MPAHQQLAPKVKNNKPKGIQSSLDPEQAEILHDALDSRNKSAESFKEDLVDAFNALTPEQIASAAAVCRDLGNEAARNERWEDAAEHYTSVLAGFPNDHEVLCNRSLCYLNLKRGQEALQDAALAVNIKPKYTKAYYRLGCAAEECKMYKECASIFAKALPLACPGRPHATTPVLPRRLLLSRRAPASPATLQVVEMEPGNIEASGRLLKARAPSAAPTRPIARPPRRPHRVRPGLFPCARASWARGTPASLATAINFARHGGCGFSPRVASPP